MHGLKQVPKELVGILLTTGAEIASDHWGREGGREGSRRFEKARECQIFKNR